MAGGLILGRRRDRPVQDPPAVRPALGFSVLAGMLGQVAGYEVRKHRTFRLITVEDDRFVAVLPPYEDADEGWRRIG